MAELPDWAVSSDLWPKMVPRVEYIVRTLLTHDGTTRVIGCILRYNISQGQGYRKTNHSFRVAKGRL
jgi:hypothetical protein